MAKSACSPVVPAAQRGWRIDRIPGRMVGELDGRRLVLPLWLVRDGEHVADLELTLSLAEAEQMRAELGDGLTVLRALSVGPVEDGVRE